MKITVTLNGAGVELDRKTIDLDANDCDDCAEISVAIHDAIEDWMLSPGDTIVIDRRNTPTRAAGEDWSGQS